LKILTPSSSILPKTQTRKMPNSNINLKGGIQCLMISRTSFLNHIVARANLIVVWQPHNKPPSTYKCFWCEKEFCVSGSISDGCPQCQKFIDKGSKLPATSLQESKTKTQKKAQSLQSHGPILKTNIFKQPFTTVNLDQSCSNHIWASTSGNLIYLDLQEAMLNHFKVCKSLHFQKFSCDLLII
ncbi:hypothetical protein VP01_5068g2, partial [Puccinia sorghi]